MALNAPQRKVGPNASWCRLAIAAAGSLTALIVAIPATAQNALGDGRTLDANPLVGSGGINSLTFGPDFAARNALITGNVVGGRGFRETVGYTAANDFRDETVGSDDLFRFRADSAMSNPVLFSAGQTMERLRFGQHLGIIEYGRAGRGATLADVKSDVGGSGSFERDRLMLDRLAMKAADDLVYRSSVDPEFIGAYRDEDGTTLLASASSLRGLVIGPLSGQPQLLGLTPYDSARVREDSARGGTGMIGRAFNVDFKNLLEPERVTDGGEADRIDTRAASNRIDPAYRNIMAEIADRYAAASEDSAATDQTALTTQLDDIFAEIRKQLGVVTPGTEPETDEPDQDDTPARSVADFGGILRHGEIIERLTAEDDPDRYQELMGQAHEMLKKGEYFWAERRFARALRFAPGHPLATAGVANAQIGAGLYVPAALALRGLFAEHPEMIDVRYGFDLLPNRVRLNIAVRKLQSDIERIRRDRELNGFLLAYLGHQLSDPTLIKSGLDTVQEYAPRDRLLPLLRTVWIDVLQLPPADDNLAGEADAPARILPPSFDD